jgi:UDP-N-acetylmuramoyl-tripeptide--D-alanyl-D-alanine ligase
VIPLSVDEVAALEAGTLKLGAEASHFTGITIDSRATGPGDLFVAVGRGSEFVADAFAQGAAAALVPTDAFAALAALGRAVRMRSAARIVGITGSTGKTSTKDILAAFCRPHRRTVAAEASHNNEIGVPLTLARIEPDTEVVVLELAMRGRGQIAELADIARPDVGVITSVGPAHLELLGTVEEVAAAKAELLTALPDGGIAVVPAGAPLLERHLRRDLEVIRFGDRGDVSLLDFRPSGAESRLEIAAFGLSLTLELNVRSRYNAHNALAALAAYHALGLPLEQAQAGARSIVLSRWREEEFELEDGSLLLNDCYNANPMSMRAALAHLAERAGARRRVAVLGEMAELGPDAPAYHREIGAAATEAGVEVLIAVGPAGRDYLDGAGEVPETRWAPDVEAAIQELKALLLPGDCVLVKGSRAVGLEAVAGALISVPAS